MLCHCNHTTQGEMCASVRMEVSTATIQAATVQRVSVAPSVKWTTDRTCVSCSSLLSMRSRPPCAWCAWPQCAELASLCSAGIVVECSCLNRGYFSNDRCFCQRGYGGPYCEVFVGEGTYVSSNLCKSVFSRPIAKEFMSNQCHAM